MRPLLLSMTAFGPFPGREHIAFDRMGEAPLFLINGPTGAGKTTILDAICFALYGRTTGDEREGSQMRADLAAAELPTEVTLVFELAGIYYRIRRSPEQQKPKSRGEGTTTRSPEAQLWQLNPEGHRLGIEEQPEFEQLLVASKVTDATREIERLTGLNADQFRQVMVLPQGKFRQLLMADSRDRERIFSQLFQTRIYKQLEERLKARAAAVRQQVEKQRQLIRGILEGSGVETEEALATELGELQPALLQAAEERQQSEQALRLAGEALQQAVQLDKAFQQLAETEAELQRLRQNSEAVAQQRQQLQLAEQARQLAPLAEQLELQQREAGRLQQQLQQAEQQRRQAAEQLQQARQQLESCQALELQLDQHKQQLATLSGYSTRADELQQASRLLQGAITAEQQAGPLLNAKQKALADLLAEKERGEQHSQQIQHRLAGLAEKQLQLSRLAERVRLAGELAGLENQQRQQQGQLQQSETTGRKLAEQHQAALQQTKILELSWHQGQAALLAAELADNQPCPVCGSCEHPQPALSIEAIPDQQQLEQAREKARQSQQQLSDAREAYQLKKKDLDHLASQITELQRQLGEERDVNALSRQHRALEAEVSELLSLQPQLQQIQQQLQQLKLQEADCRRQQELAASQLAERQTQRAAAASRHQQAESELPEAWRHAGALETAVQQKQREIAELQQRIDRIRQQFSQTSDQSSRAEAMLSSLNDQQQQQQRRVDDCRNTWQQSLQGSPFASEEAFGAALLSEADQRQLKQQIDDYDQRRAGLEGAEARQRQLLEGQQPPQPALLEQRLAEAEQRKKQQDQRWQQLDRRVSQLQGTEQKLRRARSTQQRQEQQYRLIGTLSDVACGQTGNRISLQRFVLSVLLDDVLIEASHRLSLMSKGRYQLLRKEQKARGNKASGLELEVEDAYTGKVRPVATLSGGESFMAALSMALGLSDVVQAYAGGIRLDALFIDEGFGSLDPESLDLAIRTLIDLQRSGRMIGVISHVAELKELDWNRIDLSTNPKGSSIKMHII